MRRLGLVVATCAALAASVRADELGPDELAQVGDIEELSLSELLERPVVAASRYALKPGDSPTLVSSVDAAQIALLGYRTLGEALQSMRGVYLGNDRNYSYLGVRGFSVPGDYNTRLALAIDGHRVNDALYGQAAPGLELGLPLIAIDHVELARGGAYSVYGQNALLGAIQIVTASGATRPGLVVRAGGSADAETFSDPAGRGAVAPRTQSVAASYGVVTRGVDVFAAADYQRDPGLSAVYLPGLETPDGTGVVHGGDGEEAGGAYVAIRSRHFVFHSLMSRRRKEVNTGAYAVTPGAPIETFDDRLYSDAAYVASTPHTDLEAKVSADYYGYRGTYPNIDDDGAPLPNQDSASATWITGEVRGRYKLPKLTAQITDVELAASAEAARQCGEQRNYDDGADGRVTYIDRIDASEVGALGAHARARFARRVVAFAAARGDYSAATGLTFDPQGGAVLDLGEDGRVRVAYSRGSRAPDLYEQFYQTSTYLANPGLGPEHSATGEASYERYLGTHARVLAVGYEQRITDLIALTALPDELRRFENHGTARSYGVELELEGRWDALQLRTSYAWQRSRDGDGAQLVNSPQSIAVATAIIPLPHRTTLGIETNYVGARRTLLGPEVAPAFLTSFGVTFHDLGRGFDLTLGARNVFDVRTGSPGGEEHVEAQLPADPRILWVNVSATLGGKKGLAP